MTSLQRLCRISSLTFLYVFPFSTILTLHWPIIEDSIDVIAIVTFLSDGVAGICNLLNAFSLIKFSELHESIKAVRLKLSLTLTGTESCLRPEGQAAVIVQSEG